MSGETEGDVSGWTVDTVHSHILSLLVEQRRLLDERYQTQTKALEAAFAAADKAVQAALQSAKEAVGKAEAAAEKRFEAVNEFRQTVTDITAQNVTKDQHSSDIRRIGDQVADMKARLDKAEGKGVGISVAMAGMLAAATLLISVVVVVANALLR